MIEFRCVITVSTPALWLARENIKRLTPRLCINVEYLHGVVYMENTQHRVDNIEYTTYGRTTYGRPLDQYGRLSIPIIYIPNLFSIKLQSRYRCAQVTQTAPLLGTRYYPRNSS